MEATGLKKIVVVDDLRTFDPEFLLVEGEDIDIEYIRTAPQAVEWLRTCQWAGLEIDELWLDHDLGLGGDTVGVADWMERAAFEGTPIPIKKVYIHTANPAGANRLRSGLEKWYDVETVNALDYWLYDRTW